MPTIDVRINKSQIDQNYNEPGPHNRRDSSKLLASPPKKSMNNLTDKYGASNIINE